MRVKVERALLTGILLCALICTIFYGYSVLVQNTTVLPEYVVYVNDELQTFRNIEGKKIYPLLKDGELYIPVNELGSYMGYMTIYKDNELQLYTLKPNALYPLSTLNTESIKGDTVTADILAQKDYTLVFVWAAWCEYCDKQLEVLRDISKDDYNIQIIGVPVDLPMYSNKASVTDTQLKSVTAKLQKYELADMLTVYRDSCLINSLAGNVSVLPRIFVFSNTGEIIKVFDDVVSLEVLQDYLTMLEK